MNGSELLLKISNVTGQAREQIIKEEIKENSLPAFFNSFFKIIVEQDGNKLQYFVSKEYFCLGTDEDYLVMPVTPPTIKELLIKMNCSLPTPTMVKQIYKQAEIKLPARPQKPNKGESITSSKLYSKIDTAIKKDRIKLGAKLDFLVAGHKKDVVLTNLLTKQSNKNNVAIYGWWYDTGVMIQPLNANDHIISYVDYSHGLRFVQNDCILNDEKTTLQFIWNDPKLCLLLHDEPLKFQKY